VLTMVVVTVKSSTWVTASGACNTD
jgi:hypothetical protein